MPSLTVSDVQQSLRRFCQVYAPQIIDRNERYTNSGVSWDRRTTGILRGEPYHSEYTRLVEDRDFSLLFSDRAFAQVLYVFDKNNLTCVRLAYFPRPEYLRFPREREDALLYDVSEFEETTEANTSHVRYDFDPEVESHSKSHLQFGAIQSFRLTTRRVLLPFLFLDAMRRFFAEKRHREVQGRRGHAEALAFDLRRMKRQGTTFNDSHFVLTSEPAEVRR